MQLPLIDLSRLVPGPHPANQALAKRIDAALCGAGFFSIVGHGVPSIEPLPCCVSAERPARYGPISAGEHLQAMYRRTTVAA